MFEEAVILGLYSITPVHAGSGAELSVIDLPIQRERHTGFPVIWGQSLKGVLRSYLRKLELSGKIKINGEWNWEEKARKLHKDKSEEYIQTYIERVKDGKRDPPLTEIIFGPSTEAASEHAGAISVGDAKILLFPVRSLKGVFAYVTCPLVLERLSRDLELLGNSQNLEVTASEEEAIVSDDSTLVVDNDQIILEDVVFKARKQGKNIQKITEVVSKLSPINIDPKRVAIVHDNVFRDFVKMATEIVTRVKIDAEKGTVQSGALWTEEYLPSDCLLYSVLAISKPRKEVDGIKTLDDVKNALKFSGFIQIGGNETVGKGYVKVRVASYEDA